VGGAEWVAVAVAAGLLQGAALEVASKDQVLPHSAPGILLAEAVPPACLLLQIAGRHLGGQLRAKHLEQHLHASAPSKVSRIQGAG
jgi:hypothetical protein